MKVMIVDDNKQVRRVIKSFIGDLVAEFIECGDGREVLDGYVAHRPDLVLMDYEMQQMNGFEATTQLKREFPEARVVIISQWDSPELRDAARRSGAEAYVNKKSLIPLRDFIEAELKRQ